MIQIHATLYRIANKAAARGDLLVKSLVNRKQIVREANSAHSTRTVCANRLCTSRFRLDRFWAKSVVQVLEFPSSMSELSSLIYENKFKKKHRDENLECSNLSYVLSLINLQRETFFAFSLFIKARYRSCSVNSSFRSFSFREAKHFCDRYYLYWLGRINLEKYKYCNVNICNCKIWF